MGALLLGAFALIGFLLLIQGFIGADVKGLVKGLRYTGAALLLLAALGMAAFDRVGLTMLLGSFAWALFTGGHIWPSGWSHWPSRAHPQSAPPNRSSVTTDWLEVELDHDNGEMRGRVRKGRFAERELDSFSRDEALALYDEAGQADPDSERLLDTFFARKFDPQWRAGHQSGAEEAPRPHRTKDSGMSRAEAFRVLGLEPGADEDVIRAAHRRLILQNHPDRGGSSYLAAQINEAKDVLLGT